MMRVASFLLITVALPPFASSHTANVDTHSNSRGGNDDSLTLLQLAAALKTTPVANQPWLIAPVEPSTSQTAITLPSQAAASLPPALGVPSSPAPPSSGALVPSAAAPLSRSMVSSKTTTRNSAAARAAASVAPVNGGWKGMYYMPASNVVVCTCAKCGSTSLYKFVYENSFGHAWQFAGAPYLQEVWSPRWESKFSVVTEHATQEDVMQKAYSFALIRDPKERVLSAWSSKVSCDNKTSADNTDRSVLVPELMKMAGKDWWADCLSLHDFLTVLRDIHLANKSYMLNDHFRPQSQECFQQFPPERWSKVVSIKEPGAFDELAVKLGKDAASAVVPQTHSSSHGGYKLALEDEVLLNVITMKEYAMFGSYLPKPWALWELAQNNTECTNAMDLGEVARVPQCKARAVNNTKCGRFMSTNGKSCACVPAGEHCMPKKGATGINVFRYTQDTFWAVVAKDAFCRDFKDLGSVDSVEGCQQKTTTDLECGKQIFSNGKSCACLKPGQVCDMQVSEQGYVIYQLMQ